MHIENGARGERPVGGPVASWCAIRTRAHETLYSYLELFLTLINSAEAYRAGFTDPTLN